MADFTVTRITDQDVNGVPTPQGTNPDWRKRMLGAAGAAAPGLGNWVRVPPSFKTFFLYNVSRTGSVGSASAEVHAAMELADVPDNTAHKVLATLTSGSVSFSIEEPWSYIRVELKVAGAGAVQVGMDAIE